jgi:hypothetical protein
MQRPMTQEPTPPAVQLGGRDDQPEAPAPQTSQAFYERFTRRPEIQRLLRRLAKA